MDRKRRWIDRTIAETADFGADMARALPWLRHRRSMPEPDAPRT